MALAVVAPMKAVLGHASLEAFRISRGRAGGPPAHFHYVRGRPCAQMGVLVKTAGPEPRGASSDVLVR